jgi:hypothetical protein
MDSDGFHDPVPYLLEQYPERPEPMLHALAGLAGREVSPALFVSDE